MPLATQRQETAEASQPLKLSAGRVSVWLSPTGTALRDIAFDGEVVLRGLAFVARDQDWGTLPLSAAPQIRRSGEDLEIEVAGAGDYANGDLSWRVVFRLSPEGVEAHSTVRSSKGFLTNRTGLVVLHGLQACRGREVALNHSDGRSSRSAFPVEVSPHQPFLDIAAMTHRTAGGAGVHIAFQGEVFEMEDQRNWTDASYKTYSRPLALPFPYRIGKGETSEQIVRVTFEAGASKSTEGETKPGIQVSAPMPRLATGLPVNRPPLDEAAAAALDKLGLAAVALEIDPEENGWADSLKRHLASMTGPVRVDCRMGGEIDHAAVLSTIHDVLAGRQVVGISLWDAPQSAIASAHELWPGTPVGGGTGAFFAEFNRGTLPSGINYATWTTNPTVHASDDDTLGESIEPLRDILSTAKAKAPGLDFVVGPLTLVMRFNPNATSPAARRAEPPPDSRQHTVLTASWLLGTVAGFVDPAVKHLTVFEITGPKGLLRSDGSLSPSGHLVSRLTPLSGQQVEVVIWPHEPRARGLLFQTAGGRVLVLTQARAEAVHLALPEGRWAAPERLGSEGFAADPQPAGGTINVDGFGVVWLAEIT
ncbi:hypothetical protein [Microvirga makkahensis]|uniref:Uncharacterized protein n=1 Tax=Microvirga makkahensis TaxID=1128670 RepID=A0A7X3MX44_9HYPH|nr:hypothetical protein [Microvirga makkahensis]MXQ14610.1 hypothetical protein [Microvirga makkahensis]